MSEPIRFYGPKGEWGEFSNFSLHGFTLDGYMWYTCEHFYQAYKFVPGGEKFMRIKNAGSPGKAKILGGPNQPGEEIRPDWESGAKLDVMRRGLKAKFDQNPDLKVILLSTGNRELVECSPKDDYWGVIPDGTGQNWLGRLLMELRETYRAALPVTNEVIPDINVREVAHA